MPLQEEFEKQGSWLFRYRGVLPVIFLIAGSLVYLQTEGGGSSWEYEGTNFEFYYEFACLLVSIIGLVIRIVTVGYSPDNTSGRNTKEQLADSLNTTGIYSMVRHPLYFGNFFMWMGVALLTVNSWFICAFVLLYWVYYERIMFAEEQFLRAKYGFVYIEWAKKTPAFIPDPRLFRKTSIPFSWKKVLKQEKTGLMVLFFVFSLLNVAGNYMETHKFFMDNTYLKIGFYSSFALYVVLKFLKNKTHLLDEPRA